jgi:hypothetical protein
LLELKTFLGSRLSSSYRVNGKSIKTEYVQTEKQDIDIITKNHNKDIAT